MGWSPDGHLRGDPKALMQTGKTIRLQDAPSYIC